MVLVIANRKIVPNTLVANSRPVTVPFPRKVKRKRENLPSISPGGGGVGGEGTATRRLGGHTPKATPRLNFVSVAASLTE